MTMAEGYPTKKLADAEREFLDVEATVTAEGSGLSVQMSETIATAVEHAFDVGEVALADALRQSQVDGPQAEHAAVLVDLKTKYFKTSWMTMTGAL